jgi:alanine-glyoxylate transaminase / serine-glyoxylate transaminase / serine-pyruvate transaminase
MHSHPPLHTGRHFLQIPGPTNVPDRVLSAIQRPTIDHRGPEFARLGSEIFDLLKPVFKTSGPVFVFPATGTGAWEAAIVNTLSPGDRVLMFETGHFATLWREMARRFGLEVEFIPGDWRGGVDPELVEQALSRDPGHHFKAVMIVHNETSTGVASRVGEVRRAMNRADHPALLMVDTISSLGSIDYRHDDWQVDVTVAGSQKGLMLPPGLSFNAVSNKALKASKTASLPRTFWDWEAMLEANAKGFFPYTPSTNLLFGLREALHMILEEGLENVFARHDRLAEATRRAARAWGLEIQCSNPAEYSSSLTALRIPDGHDADRLRQVILESFDMSLGNGLSKLQGKVFRIGHLGAFNELMLAGTLAGVEMGLTVAGVPHERGGVSAALAYLAESASQTTAGSTNALKTGSTGSR